MCTFVSFNTLLTKRKYEQNNLCHHSFCISPQQKKKKKKPKMDLSHFAVKPISWLIRKKKSAMLETKTLHEKKWTLLQCLIMFWLDFFILRRKNQTYRVERNKETACKVQIWFIFFEVGAAKSWKTLSVSSFPFICSCFLCLWLNHGVLNSICQRFLAFFIPPL